MRAWHLRHTYDLTIEQYDAMVLAQNGMCAICQGPPPGKFPLVVDHDHDTGRIRGLLCNTCNSLMGRWGDDPEILMAAARYLLQGRD